MKKLMVMGLAAVFAMTGMVSAQNLLLNGDFALEGSAENIAASWTQWSGGGWNNRERNVHGIGGDTNNWYLAMGTADWAFADNGAFQNVAVADDGAEYKLSVDSGDTEAWWHGHGEAKIVFLDAGAAELDSASVVWGDDFPYDYAAPWENYSVTATAPAGTAEVAVYLMNQWGNDGGGSMRFDNAVLQVVPEPATLGLLGLSGLALWVVRRRI